MSPVRVSDPPATAFDDACTAAAEAGSWLIDIVLRWSQRFGWVHPHGRGGALAVGRLIVRIKIL